MLHAVMWIVQEDCLRSLLLGYEASAHGVWMLTLKPLSVLVQIMDGSSLPRGAVRESRRGG